MRIILITLPYSFVSFSSGLQRFINFGPRRHPSTSCTTPRASASWVYSSYCEMVDSFTLSHEPVTNLNTDNKAQRQQSGRSPHVTRRENKEEQLRQNCGRTGQRDVVLVRVISEQAPQPQLTWQLETGRRSLTRHHQVSTKLDWRHILKTENGRIWMLRNRHVYHSIKEHTNPVDPAPNTQQAQQQRDVLWRVSALTSERSLRCPSFSTVAQSGVEILRQFSNPNSRNDERTCLRSGRTLKPVLAPFQCSTEIDSFLHHVIIVSHQQWSPIHTFSTIVSSATSDRRVEPKYWVLCRRLLESWRRFRVSCSLLPKTLRGVCGSSNTGDGSYRSAVHVCETA